MLDNEYLWNVADKVVELWEEIEDWCIRDIAERIIKALEYGYQGLPATAEYREMVLKNADMHLEEMIRRISKRTGQYEQEVRKLFLESGQASVDDDYERAYKARNLNYIMVEQSGILRQIMESAYQGTNGEMRNFMNTSALSSQKMLIDALDKAYWEIASGARSYSEGIREIITDVGKQGMTVTYESGYKDSLEASIRRSVLTGLNQGTSRVSMENARTLGVEYMIVDSHLGARVSEKDPIANHAGWQGKIYKIEGADDYAPNLKEHTGFPNNPLGLCGYNCRHHLFPHFKGDPNPFKQYDSQENKRAYELSQKQRARERTIRGTRKELIAQKAAMDACTDDKLKFELSLDYGKNAAKLRKQNKAYEDFCSNNNLKTQKERLQVAGWDREQSSAANGAATRYANTKEKAKTVVNSDGNGIIKNIELPAEIRGLNGISEDIVEEISKAFENLKEEYDVKINQLKVMKLGDDSKNIPFQYIPSKGKEGSFVYCVVINSEYDFCGSLELFNARIMRNYNKNVLAAKTVEDLIAHEFAHVMTFQDIKTYSGFLMENKILRNKFVEGISLYSDACEDGAETIAESFVRMRNGEEIPEKAAEYVKEYILRWRPAMKSQA